MKRELAEHYFQYGVIMTALALYKELHLLEDCVNCVMVGFEDCRRHYKHPDKVVVTGTPVRGDFFELTKAQARQKLGYTDDKPLVVSFWGSLGASTMNERMLAFFEREKQDGFPFHQFQIFSIENICIFIAFQSCHLLSSFLNYLFLCSKLSVS